MTPDWDDWRVEQALARSRRRRQRVAGVMVLLLVVPIGLQLLVVGAGVATRYGLMAVALPATVALFLLRRR